MMTKGEKKPQSDLLYETILTLKDLDECKNFFADLCTVAELRAMEQRFEEIREARDIYELFAKLDEKLGQTGPEWSPVQAG